MKISLSASTANSKNPTQAAYKSQARAVLKAMMAELKIAAPAVWGNLPLNEMHHTPATLKVAYRTGLKLNNPKIYKSAQIAYGLLISSGTFSPF